MSYSKYTFQSGFSSRNVIVKLVSEKSGRQYNDLIATSIYLYIFTHTAIYIRAWYLLDSNVTVILRKNAKFTKFINNIPWFCEILNFLFKINYNAIRREKNFMRFWGWRICLNIKYTRFTFTYYVVASRETSNIHVRAIDTAVQESAVSSLALEIAKTPRHHFNLFTSARCSLFEISPFLSFHAGTRASHPCCSYPAVSENVKYRPAQLASNN